MSLYKDRKEERSSDGTKRDPLPYIFAEQLMAQRLH
jgi:hypothetical protein